MEAFEIEFAWEAVAFVGNIAAADVVIPDGQVQAEIFRVVDIHHLFSLPAAFSSNLWLRILQDAPSKAQDDQKFHI